LISLLLAAVLAQTAQSRPPTVDPTYGLPVPPVSNAPVRLAPDAKWVWAAHTRDSQTIYLLKVFSLGAPPANAVLYVTADNFFTAYVNGEEVGETHDVPGNGELWASVQRYNVSRLLRSGANTIAIEGRNAGGLAGVLARMEIDGKPALYTDATWLVSETKPTSGWPGFAPSSASWAPATMIAPAAGDPWGSRLQGWPVELNAVPMYLRHFKIRPISWAFATEDLDHLAWRPFGRNHHYIYAREAAVPPRLVLDFGKELSGRVDAASVDFPAGASIEVGTGESVGEALEKPYTRAKLDAANRFGPYSAFRYVVLTLKAGVVLAVPNGIVADHLYYPVNYAGRFDCSDPLLTKIWYTGAYTAHLCMQQDIWDAPKRDRARWMGDLHVSGEVINDAFLDRFLMEQTMDRLRKDAQGGQPADKLPRQHVNGIPGYTCAWIAGLADFYRHTGDLAYLKSQHQALVTMLEYMRGEIGPDGIFANKYKQWPFVDWAPKFNGDSPEARAATHLFYVKAIREAVFLLHALGDNEAAKLNNGWAELLEIAAQAKLVRADNTFGDRRQENAMAIYSGVANAEQRRKIYAAIFRPGAPAWDYQATPYYNNYVIYAMSLAGHTPEALDFVRKYWGGMIAEGATTFWEGYDPKWDKHNAHIHLQADDGEGYFVSLCHGWSAGATSWLTDRVLGVRSTGAGFSTCVIQPELADLKWAEGAVPTPHGPIQVHFDRTASGLHARVSVPNGVEAIVTIPGRSPVTVSGGRLELRS
jgi:hypothetical protein